MKQMQEEVEVALKKAQEDMKKQVDRKRKESEEWKKKDRVMLSAKNLVFKEKAGKEISGSICRSIYN